MRESPRPTSEQEEVRLGTAEVTGCRWVRCCCHSRKAGLGAVPGPGGITEQLSCTSPETPPTRPSLL